MTVPVYDAPCMVLTAIRNGDHVALAQSLSAFDGNPDSIVRAALATGTDDCIRCLATRTEWIPSLLHAFNHTHSINEMVRLLATVAPTLRGYPDDHDHKPLLTAALSEVLVKAFRNAVLEDDVYMVRLLARVPEISALWPWKNVFDTEGTEIYVCVRIATANADATEEHMFDGVMALVDELIMLQRALGRTDVDMTAWNELRYKLHAWRGIALTQKAEKQHTL